MKFISKFIDISETENRKIFVHDIQYRTIPDLKLVRNVFSAVASIKKMQEK
jgi:hypothetical protein